MVYMRKNGGREGENINMSWRLSYENHGKERKGANSFVTSHVSEQEKRNRALDGDKGKFNLLP